MARKGIGGHQSARGGTDTWLTPPHICEALGPFDLDPATPRVQPWPTAATRYTRDDDALSIEWPRDKFVFCNPPYSLIGEFMSRAAAHGNGVALVFARTETRWWFESVWPHASAILFLNGRLHFHYLDGSRAAGNAGGPHALVGYGPEAARRLSRCGLAGALVGPVRVLGSGTPRHSSVSGPPRDGAVDAVAGDRPGNGSC